MKMAKLLPGALKVSPFSEALAPSNLRTCACACSQHKYLGSVIFVFKNTLTTTFYHKTCINPSG